MKKQFSTYWKGSSKARKQRKYSFEAPQHLRQKMLSCHLSKDLRKKYSRRSFPVKKGDTVIVLAGENRKKTGKISFVNLKNFRVAIDGIQLTKKDGSKVNILFSPSNLMITEINLDDKKRLDSVKKESGQDKSENKEIKGENKK